jgi:TonB family protein
MKASARFVTSCAMVVLTAVAAAGQDPLSRARDLYAGASYEDALVLLNRLRADGPRSDEIATIDEYRAFCLLALGRAADAEQAIEAVLVAEPSYQPSGSEVSPRVRSAFTDVRRRMLPALVQQRYAAARAAFDRKDFVQATAGFKQVLDFLAAPDLASTASTPPLSDLKTLALGFYDLSASAAAPAPPPPPPPLPPPPSPVAIEPAPVPVPVPAPAPVIVVPSQRRIYGPNDPGVVAPVTVRQSLPAFPVQTTAMRSASGSIDVLIDETGAVESATMSASVNPLYDRLALAAARKWQFKAASLNGVPVKFRKTIQISVQR